MGESTLTGTQFASINTSYSSYSIAWIGSYTYTQDPYTNTTQLTLYGSMYTDSGSAVRSDYATLRVNGDNIAIPSAYAYGSSGYSVTRYYSLFGNSTPITIWHNADGTFPTTTIGIYANDYHHSDKYVTGTISGLPSIDVSTPTVTANASNAGKTACTLQVTTNVDCDLWEYKVGNGSWVQFSTANSREQWTNVTDLSPGTTYTITARARKTSNHRTGTGTTSITTINVIPATITLSATDTSATAATVTATTDNDCYKWEYKVGSGSYTTFSTTNGRSASVSVTGLTSGTNTVVTVRVTRTLNDVISTQTITIDKTAPTVSTELTGSTSSSLTVKATASKTCNRWEYSTDNGSTYTQFSTTSGTTATATISGLANNTTYKVRIRARAANYVTGASSSASYSTTDGTAPTVTISLASRTSSSLTVSVTTNATCNLWEYSINDGSSFTQFSTASATSVSCTITGLSPNTTYNVKIRARKASNSVKGTSARGAYTTIGAAQLNSATEIFADASTVQVKINGTFYSSTFTYSLQIKRGSTVILTLSIAAQSATTKDVTVTLTSAQRTTLLNGMSDVASFSATYALLTYNNSTQIGSASTATATIKTSSSTSAPAQPTFSYADTNSATIAVTGDSSKLVAGQSTLRLTSLSATAKNGASIASYSITIGGVTKSSTSGGTVNVGVISQSGTLALKVTAKDTRGYTSTKSVSVTCYAYAYPSLSSYSVKRDDTTASQINFSANGTFSNIGSNTVTLKYKYKKTSAGSYGTEVTVTPTKSGGTFSYSANNIATFDEDSTYNFVITVQDGIQSVVYNLVVPTFTPLIAYRPNAVGFGAVPQGTRRVEIAQDWSLVANGKNNTMAYMPYSWGTTGGGSVNGWARIAQINITGNNLSEPMEFRVFRRLDGRGVTLTLTFANADSTDPSVASFYYDSIEGTFTNNSFNAFVYKEATSTWGVYVKKSAPGDYIMVYTTLSRRSMDRCNIVYADALYDTNSVPSGAVMATPISNAANASAVPFDYAPVVHFQIAAGASKRITATSECSLLVSVNGWNSTMRRGLWFIGAYSDSSRADVIYMLGNYTNTLITITGVSGQLAWDIANTSNTLASVAILPLWGTPITVT